MKVDALNTSTPGYNLFAIHSSASQQSADTDYTGLHLTE
jgi:hypothetical protein